MPERRETKARPDGLEESAPRERKVPAAPRPRHPALLSPSAICPRGTAGAPAPAGPQVGGVRGSERNLTPCREPGRREGASPSRKPPASWERHVAGWSRACKPAQTLCSLTCSTGVICERYLYVQLRGCARKSGGVAQLWRGADSVGGVPNVVGVCKQLRRRASSDGGVRVHSDVQKLMGVCEQLRHASSDGGV